MKKFLPGILSVLFTLLFGMASAQSVWTQHNDLARTGWYPYETSLNTTNVNQNTFGFFFSHMTDDKIVGQPLVIMNVNIPNKGFKNLVFVATLNNSIYAFDADVNADPYWKQNYTNNIAVAPNPPCTNCRPARASDIHPSLCGGNYGDFSGNMGIISTPVIDTAAGTMYFVTKVVDLDDGTLDNHAYNSAVRNEEYTYTTTCFHQYLHAIDITTGNERPNSPIEIKPTITGTGDGQTSPGIITFNPRTQFNRAGLVLANGYLYIAFAAHCDNNPSHGWIISYNPSTLTLQHAFISTPNDGRGGMWMSGTAPAVDENGNLYVTTGNALDENRSSFNYNTYTAPPTDPANRGEGVIELAPDLTLASYFTPFNYIALNDADKDFPTQVMLLPNTNLAMTGCKDDTIYVMNKNNLGGFDPYKNDVVQTVSVQSGATMHSSFAYFGSPTAYAYQFSENSQLKAYPVSAGGLGTSIVNTSIAGPSGGSGGFLSSSSNGSDPSSGILWAYQAINGCNANNSNCHAILHALKASDITTELWNSDMVSTDQISVFNKFSCPTIALGKVYVDANTNYLYVYGLKSNNSCATNVALGKPATPLTTSAGTASNVTDGNFSTGWIANPNNDVDSIYIDLQGNYDICKVGITWINGDYGKNFNIKVSNDKINWTIIDSMRGNTGTYNEFNGLVTARYVSMVGITRGTTNGYGISEFQVFGNPASSCRAPGALGASSSSSNTAHLSWDLTTGAAQYFIKYRSNLSESWISRTSNTNSIDLSALTCGPIYYYTVQADCGSSQSAISQGSFTITSCPLNSCDIFPVRYYNVDLGDIGVAGSTCKQGNIYSVTGSGTDIGGNSDQFQFAYTNNDIGSYDVFGRIISQDKVNASNKFGVMVRDSLTNTSRFAFLASFNDGYNMIFEYRDQPAGPTTRINVPGNYSLPYWTKINKSGTLYTAYISADGISWTPVAGPFNLNFGLDPANIPNYGMAETSDNNSSLSTGEMDNFTLLGSTALPIVLTSFSAKEINHNHVLVSWTTSMVHLADHFEVQRSSDDKNFQTIQKVIAVGESETPQYYSANDNNPFTGVNYYQLKEIDKDGKFYISPVVTVNFDRPAGIEIYPNPAGDYTSINSQKDAILEVNIYDVTGKLLKTIPSTGELTFVRLNTSWLSGGIYFISVKTTSTIYRQKLLKN